MADFKNRIIGLHTQLASKFNPNPSNWRTHPEAQKKELRKALTGVGWVGVPVVNRRTGNVIDGHARIEEAKAGADSDVPYLLVDLTEAEEKQILATFDPINAMAEEDTAALERLLEELKTEDDAEPLIFEEQIEPLVEMEQDAPPEIEDEATEDEPAPEPEEVDEIVNFVRAETEYHPDAGRLAERAIAHVAESFRRIVKSNPDGLTDALMVIVSPEGMHRCLVLVDPKLTDIIQELERRHEDGESSPLDGLFGSIWDLSTNGDSK